MAKTKTKTETNTETSDEVIGTGAILQRIQQARTIKAIDALLAVAASPEYRFASNKTRRRWKVAAHARSAELNNPPKEVVEQETEKPKRKPRKKAEDN